MARKSAITKEIIDELISMVNEGATYKDAAKQLGFHSKSLHLAADRMGIALPTKRREGFVEDILAKHKDVIEAGQLSLHRIGEMYDFSQPYLSRKCKDLGIKPGLKFSKRESVFNTPANAQLVVDYIMQNGGYVTAAIKSLGLNALPQYVRDYAKDRGIDLKFYRYSNLRFGHWRVLPCDPEPIYTSDYKVKAECTLCERTYDVSLVNLKSGLSSCCVECSRTHPFRYVVSCQETGQTYRSILAFANAIGEPQRYNSIRRSFINKGEFNHAGLVYVLIDAE